jgi:DNA adenine methylase
VNAKGYFNVPFGQQTNPDLIQSDNFRNVSRFLNGPLHQGSQAKVSLVSGDYRKATLLAERKDFVYFDPPYDPISSTSSFVSYHNSGFGKADQIELRDEIIRLSEMKIPILLSNSDTPFIRSLYNDGKIFEIERVTVQRAIGATAASRIVVGELLINNYKAVGVDLTDDRK